MCLAGDAADLAGWLLSEGEETWEDCEICKRRKIFLLLIPKFFISSNMYSGIMKEFKINRGNLKTYFYNKESDKLNVLRKK